MTFLEVLNNPATYDIVEQIEEIEAYDDHLREPMLADVRGELIKDLAALGYNWIEGRAQTL